MKHQRIKAPHLDPREPAYWQERHSATEAVVRKVGHEGKKVLTNTRQRKQDIRLFDGLTEAHQQAMVDILDGFNYVTRPIAGKIMMYAEHIPGTGDKPSYYEQLYFYQKAWARLGQRGRFNLPMAHAIIIDGKSLRRVAVEFRTQIRNAKSNLVDSLDEYIILKDRRRKTTKYHGGAAVK